jgi:Toprim domain-containing protein
MSAERAEPERCADCGRWPPAPEDGGPPHPLCYSCLARRLNERAADLAAELLPNGYLEHGRYWRCGDVHGAPGQSLAIEICGRRSGHWKDYASAGDMARGDMLDLVRWTRCGGDRLKALREAEAYLRMPIRERSAPRARPRRRQQAPEEMRAAALRIWQQAKPLQPGDIAWRYFAGRGIDLARLPPLPSLRLHPRLMHPSGKARPALIAAVTPPSGGKLQGVHRTWLRPLADGRVEKAPFPGKHGPAGNAKLSLGDIAGHLVPLTRGQGGRPPLALAEGIEDAATAAVERPAWRTAAAVSLANMLGLVLPEQVGEIILLAQNDAPGSDAARLLPRVIRHFQEQGRRVSTLRPRDRGVKDINDLARRARSADRGAAAGPA